MGINPNAGDGVEKNYTIDGRQDAENLVTEAEHTGQEAGKAFSHIAAQADSANNGMSELSQRIGTLEAKLKTLQESTPEKYDYIAPNQLVVIQRRGEIVTMSARVTIPAGATYTDINLPDWAKPVKFDFLQFPASYQDATGRGQVRKSEGVARIFGAENQKLNFSTAWCI